MALSGIGGSIARGVARGMLGQREEQDRRARQLVDIYARLQAARPEEEDQLKGVIERAYGVKFAPGFKVSRPPKPFSQRPAREFDPSAPEGLTVAEWQQMNPRFNEQFVPALREERERAEKERGWQEVARAIAAWQQRYPGKPLPQTILAAAQKVGHPVATRQEDVTAPIEYRPTGREPKEGEPTGTIQIPTGEKRTVEDLGLPEKPIPVHIPGLGVVDLRSLSAGAQSAIIGKMFEQGARVVIQWNGQRHEVSQAAADRLVENMIRRGQQALIRITLPDGQTVMVSPSEYAQIKNALKQPGGAGGGVGVSQAKGTGRYRLLPTQTKGGMSRVVDTQTGAVMSWPQAVQAAKTNPDLAAAMGLTTPQGKEPTESVNGRPMTLAQIEDEMRLAGRAIKATKDDLERAEASRYLQRLTQARTRLLNRTGRASSSSNAQTLPVLKPAPPGTVPVDARDYAGQIVQAPNGKRYQSDGKNWYEVK